MNLNVLNVQGTGIDSLRSLEGCSVRSLNISHTAVTDLSPVGKIENLRVLDCRGCRLPRLDPLTGTEIMEVWIDANADVPLDVLRQIPTLKTVNGTALDEFFKNR
jgi:hypothetical protein